MKTLSIGTISEGTLRPDDLLHALAYELARCIHNNPESRDDSEARAVREARDMLKRFASLDPEEDAAALEDGASELIDELQEYLQGFAPPFARVGTLDGDGACIGVWPDFEAIESAIRDGDVLPMDDSTDPEAISPEDYEALYHVNDHGNATLYTWNPEPVCGCHWREAWSVV